MKRAWLYGGTILIAVALIGLAAQRPAVPRLPSFPSVDVHPWIVHEQGYSDGGPSVTGAISGARIWEPWRTALPKLDRDLTAQGFRKTSEGSSYVVWKRADAFAMADSHWEKGRPLVLTGFHLNRRATVLETLSMKVRSAFARR